MVDLLSLLAPPAAPAVRRPIFEVTLGGATADDPAGAVVALAVELGVAPAVTVAELSVTLPAAVGDDVLVSLGYADSSAEAVFTGSVSGIAHTLAGPSRVTATDGGAALARLRLNQSFESQTAGDIVRDLAGRAEVSTGTVEDGPDLPFYVVDDRRTAWEHVAGLARRSGFLATVDAEGKLGFGPPASGSPAASFTYGVDLLALEVTQAAPLAAGLRIVGEGAAGSQGSDAWSWLVNDPAAVAGTAGTPGRVFSDPALRSAEAAKGAANAAFAASEAWALTGRLLVPGSPAVTPGSTVEVSGAPQEALNGSFRVLRVRHALSKTAGFTTRLHFVKAGAGGGGLAGLLGGLL